MYENLVVLLGVVFLLSFGIWRVRMMERDADPQLRVSWLKHYSPYFLVAVAALLYAISSGHIDEIDRNLQIARIPQHLSYTHQHLQIISGLLQDYHRRTGKWPSNDEGLAPVIAGVEELKSEKTDEYSERHLVLAHLRTDEGQVYSIWGDAIVYENRLGLPPEKFPGSSATRTGVPYAIRVADGIYIWSLGAQQQYDIYRQWGPRLERWRHGRDVAVLLLLAATTLCAVVYSPRGIVGGRRSFFAKAVVWKLVATYVLGLVIFLFGSWYYLKTCYEASLTYPRSDKLTADYLALIDRYHDRGVLSDTVYEKLIDSAEKPAPHY